MTKVSQAISRLSPEQRALLEKKLQQKRAQSANRPQQIVNQLQPRPADSEYPLSAGQQRLFMLSQFTPNSTAHNITEAIRLRGELNQDILRQSIAQIVKRHESLRAVFAESEGRPIQTIRPVQPIDLHIISVSTAAAEDLEAEIQRRIMAEQSHVFNLSQGPLYRFCLLNLSANEHILVVTMHHIISDGWSFGILFKEMSSNYAAMMRGEVLPTEPMSIQYADFAHWQQEWLQTDKADAQRSYWQETLAAPIASLELPSSPSLQRQTSSPKSNILSKTGALVKQTLAPQLVEKLQSISRDAGVTLYITLLSGFKAALWRYSGQTDIIVCSPTIGRKQTETESLIGYFNNIVAIRTSLNGDPNFGDIQSRIQASLIAAYDNDELPFQQVASSPQLARVALTKALFTLQESLNTNLSLPDVDIEPVDFDSSASDFEIALYMEWQEENLVAALEYDTGLLNEADANQLLTIIIQTLDQMAATPTTTLQTLEPILLAEAPDATDCHRYQTGSNCVAANEHRSNNKPRCTQHEDAASESVQPPTALESQLLQIWQEVLGLESIEKDDNFFELGGHSMTALRLFNQIEEEVTREKLPLALLFQAPTVAQLAAAIHSDESESAWSLVVPLQQAGDGPPLFCIHAAGGNVLLYNDLARHLASSGQSVYGIQSQGLDGKKPILKTVEEMAEVYVEEILAVQSSGPYLLTGYCLGGTVAFDVAQRLFARGHEVAFLGLLETYNWANMQDVSLLGNLKYQGQRAEFMVRNFMMLDSEQRQDFFKGKLERVQGRTSVWRGSLKSALGKNEESGKNEDAILAELWETNDEAAEAYVPSSYPGKITQFIPAKDYSEYNDPALLWDDIAQGGVDVHKLSVYPAGMVYEPFVGTLAQHIQSCIEDALQS